MDWQKGHQRKPHWRPKCQLDELRQVYSRHGGQHRAEEIPGGPENPPRQLVSARLPPNPGFVNHTYTPHAPQHNHGLDRHYCSWRRSQCGFFHC